MPTASPAAPPAFPRLAPENIAMNAKAAKTVAEATGGRPAVLEPKLDGWRILANVREDGVWLYTRSGQSLRGRLPLVEAELADRFPAGTWLDGEAVGMKVTAEGTFVHDWGLAQSVLSTTRGGHHRRDEITLVLFDLIAHGGIDARSLPFRQRRQLLESVFARDEWNRVQLGVQLEATEANHAALIAEGFEGSMVKLLDSPYQSGRRGPAQRKLKATHTVEVVVTGFKPGESSFSGMVGAVEFGQHDADGNLVPRGRCSGMRMADRVSMTEHPDRWLGAVLEIAHMGAMPPNAEYPLGALRHPQYKRLRLDRTADSVLIHDK